MARNTSLTSHRWDTALDPACVPLFLTLQWAHARSLESMRPVLARHGLSAAEFDVLATLRNAVPPYQLTPSLIQDEVVITSGGLTKILLQLEARGLVLRHQLRSDLRMKPVQLSERGQQTIEAAMADMLAGLRAWIGQALDGDEIGQLTALLGRLVEAPASDAGAP